MLFKIEKSELMDGFMVAQKGIGKSPIPILNGISIETNKDSIILKGSDSITTVITTCKATILEEGSAVLDNKILLDMKRFVDGEMTFSLKDDGLLTVQSGRTKAQFPILGSKKEYPSVNLIGKDNTFKINSEVFKTMVQKTSYAVAKDETRPILTGVCIQYEDNELKMAALDGYRMSIETRKIDLDKNFMLVVPVKPLMELTKIITSEDLLVYYNDNNIMFEFDNTTIQTRLLEGNYIKYTSLIPQDNDINLTINSSELKEVINRCLIVSREKNLVTLNIGEKNLVIKSSDTTSGTIEDEIECTSNKELQIAFNGAYLLDVCNHYKGDLNFSFKNSVSPCVVTDSENNGLSLVLPVRILKK